MAGSSPAGSEGILLDASFKVVHTAVPASQCQIVNKHTF